MSPSPTRPSGIVGIKQLFPYTNIDLPHGHRRSRLEECRSICIRISMHRCRTSTRSASIRPSTGACLLIDRRCFDDCGGFDEAYCQRLRGHRPVHGGRQRGRKIVCCTSAFIYHYGQISEGRTADDDAERGAVREQVVGPRSRVDRDDYLDPGPSRALPRPARASSSTVRTLADDCIYLADDLGQGSALTWVNAELALALRARAASRSSSTARDLSPTLSAADRQRLSALAPERAPIGGVQIKWSHYRPRHLNLELAGDLNLEFFVINYLFGQPGVGAVGLLAAMPPAEPSRQASAERILQVGAAPASASPSGDCHVLHHGYSARDPGRGAAPAPRARRFRFLTVTNSHDLERYNTQSIIDAYRAGLC